jgi:hypothetical protein
VVATHFGSTKHVTCVVATHFGNIKHCPSKQHSNAANVAPWQNEMYVYSMCSIKNQDMVLHYRRLTLAQEGADFKYF